MTPQQEYQAHYRDAVAAATRARHDDGADRSQRPVSPIRSTTASTAARVGLGFHARLRSLFTSNGRGTQRRGGILFRSNSPLTPHTHTASMSALDVLTVDPPYGPEMGETRSGTATHRGLILGTSEDGDQSPSDMSIDDPGRISSEDLSLDPDFEMSDYTNISQLTPGQESIPNPVTEFTPPALFPKHTTQDSCCAGGGDSYGASPSSNQTFSYSERVSKSENLCVMCNGQTLVDSTSAYAVCSPCRFDLEFSPTNRPAAQRRAHERPHRSPTVEKCVVCQIRVRCTGRSGERYETCGNSCRRILEDTKVEKCDVCHQRPKRITASATYDQCGRTCRDKAEAMKVELAKAMKGTCLLCLVCWISPMPDGISWPIFQCSEQCCDAVIGKAPTMVEVPRGHVHFDHLKEGFEQEWDKDALRKISIKRQYHLVPTAGVSARHSDHKTQLTHMSKGRVPTERYYWMPITRQCTTGDSGILKPCSSLSCLLCDLIKNGFTREKYSCGITVSPSAPRADSHISLDKMNAKTRILVILEVVHAARLPEIKSHQIRNPPTTKSSGPRLPDVARVVERNKAHQGDVHVFNLDAMLPIGVLLYGSDTS